MQIVGADGPRCVLATINAHLEAGRFYTLVIVGNAARRPRLEAFLIEDALSRREEARAASSSAS